MTTESKVLLGCRAEVNVRSNLVPGRPCMILSSGYGIFGFEEPVQVALIRTLETFAIGWAQYEYVERNPSNATTDLLISSGINALDSVRRWVVSHEVGQLGLFGISFGANITMEVGLLASTDLMLLVNPVFDYVDYRQRQLGSETMRSWEKDAVVSLPYEREVKSYFRFIEEARHQDLLARIRSLSGRIIVCQGSADTILGRRYLKRVEKTVPHAEIHVIPHADHPFFDTSAIGAFLEIVRPALQEWSGSGR